MNDNRQEIWQSAKGLANRNYAKILGFLNVNKQYIAYVMIIVFSFVMIYAPSLFHLSTSVMTLIALVMLYAIIALGLNILLGYSGLISLGTAGFMGLGAYATAYLTVDMKLPFLEAFLITLAVSVLIGLFVGFISLRIEGFYLAIVTLCISEIMYLCFGQFDQFTGGFSGKSGKYPILFGYTFNHKADTFMLVAGILGLLMFLMNSLINSSTGRAMLTMKNSEAAAQAMGINIVKYRLIAFGFSTFYASVAGILYMYFMKYSSPVTWTLALSLNIFAVIIIGGLRSIFGTVIGAFIVFGMNSLVLAKIPVVGQINGFSYVVYGLLMILIVLFYPNGIMQLFYDLIKLLNFIYSFLYRLFTVKKQTYKGKEGVNSENTNI